MLEPAHLLAFAANGRRTRRTIGSRIRASEQNIEKMQADARRPASAATGTNVMTCRRRGSLVRMTTRSFLQNSFSTRRSAIGLTFQVSPEM